MISIIGGSGFIGTRLAHRLKSSGIEFRIIDIKESKSFPNHTVIADVRSLEVLNRAVSGSTTIINLAAEHRDNVLPLSLYDEVNVGGAENVCKAAETNGIERIVFTSSVAVYGFAPIGTDESGEFNPFNDYGRTKLEAESIFKAWREQAANNRMLTVVRPTVVFGEGNRGNVYNLLRQIASGKFAMIGNGENVKSMAYVENIAAFLEFSLNLPVAMHCYNYIDKPDFSMNRLVGVVHKVLGKKPSRFRLPYFIGFTIGWIFDCISLVTRKDFPISAIRVKKFCSNSMFNSSAAELGFVAPVELQDGLIRTVHYEFVDNNGDKEVFFTE